MDSLPGAAAIVRGLLVLARSGASGVLSVHADALSARVGVRGGRVVALTVAPEDGAALGPTLRAMGAWDEAAARAHGPAPAGEPLGRWAARVGVSEASAVSLALRKQLRARTARLFAAPIPDLRLRAGSAELGVPALEEPPSSAELLVDAVRARMRDVPLLTVRRKLGSGVLVLAPLGRELLEGAPLWPDEAAMVARLRGGATVDSLVHAARGSARAQRLLYGLRLTGACAPPSSRRGAYALLLRKSRALEARAGANDLLELPPDASPRERRRALRRLARELHPDRFGGDAEVIQRASTRVMSALHRAAR